LFGRMSLRSRITVTDVSVDAGVTFATPEVPEAFSPNYHHLGTFRIAAGGSGRPYFEITALKGRKFARGRGPVAEKARMQRVEAIPAGALLRGAIRVVNLLPEELGGLLA